MTFALRIMKILIHVRKIVMNKAFMILVSYAMCSLPSNFNLNDMHASKVVQNHNDVGLPSNGIIDIGIADENLIFFGTGGGLGKAVINGNNVLFSSFISSDLPRGGNPALFVLDSIVVISGVVDTLVQGDYLSKGTGVSVSLDYGLTWNYFPQPIDSIPDEGKYLYTNWFNETVQQLAVTVSINNISYDLSVNGDYIYSASWAGGVRRIKFKNLSTSEQLTSQKWEIIPLPLDDSYELLCNSSLPSYYVLDPNDPSNGGSHNHKGFAVESHNDSIIWVGTANGINKGIINQNNCISWTHYTSETHNISGNWVVGFNIQRDMDRVWAITWSTNSTEKNGVSYSDDFGESWTIPDHVKNLDLKIYNISTRNEKVYLSSDKGLYCSLDGQYWEKLSRPIEYNDGIMSEQILSESVYSAEEADQYLWVGTGDGLGRTENLGFEWDAYRFFEDPDDFYAYPNPFFTEFTNLVGDQGHVRFLCKSDVNPIKIVLFDSSMNVVNELDSFVDINDNKEIIWDGRNSLNKIVSNGVYFCNLIYENGNSWTKLVVIN